MALKLTGGIRLGLVIAVLGLALAGCRNSSGDSHADLHAGEHSSAHQAEHGPDAGHHVGALPREHRLAFMRGHVEAGLALYRAGEPEMAAPHLLHPVSETHKSERQGLDELGFKGELFEAVSKALDSGIAADEIEPQLKAAEANLRLVSQRAGGDTSGIIRFLMETIVEEYTIAITDGKVTDPGEYQDAFGFAAVAKQQAQGLKDRDRPEVISKINALIKMWPAEGPIPPSNPSSIEKITAKVSEVQALLQ